MGKETNRYGYIYTFKYDAHLTDLSKLESRQIFDAEQQNKMIFPKIKIDPSVSPFIKNRFEIILSTKNYSDLIKQVKRENIVIDGFKVEYLTLEGDNTRFPERQQKLKDIGWCIEGEPNFHTPDITYSICQYNGILHFGLLTRHNTESYKHKKKPQSFSNSIDMIAAKTLVNLAAKGNKNKQLLDACCGVGTVLLEACCSGYDIEGCDINKQAYLHTQENLAHYNYKAKVYHSDIKYITKNYDAVIIDLPYNLYAVSTDEIVLNIIQSSVKLSHRLVIVSIADISSMIAASGLSVIDFCTVEKKGKSTFERSIWVCEKSVT